MATMIVGQTAIIPVELGGKNLQASRSKEKNRYQYPYSFSSWHCWSHPLCNIPCRRGQSWQHRTAGLGNGHPIWIDHLHVRSIHICPPPARPDVAINRPDNHHRCRITGVCSACDLEVQERRILIETSTISSKLQTKYSGREADQSF